ncbi:MAG: serine/threonine protein kinase [Alphaproteobacteria bacterium]|nr:serine/threonine protein kinase [Alphaproteobacteria bacterium]
MAEDGPQVGTILDDRFRISRLVAENALGRSFVARDRETRKQVAVRLVRPDLMRDHADHFLQTSELASRLTAPTAVHVHTWGVQEGWGYRVTEWESSAPLADALDEAVLLSTAVSWMTDVARALADAHALGLVHGGLSPHVIRLVRRNEPPGQTRVDDWALGRMLEGGDPMSSTGLLYTDGAAWLSPQYLLGKPTDAKSDLYAVGCLLFRCITGRPPYTGPSMKVMAAHVGEAVPSPSQHASGVPPWLDDLVIALLAKDPADRPEDAAAVVRMLTEGATHLVDGAAHPDRVTANPPPMRLPRVEIRGAGAARTPELVDRPSRATPVPAAGIPIWFFALLAGVGLASFALSFILCMGDP